ncbi:uncharacterized protein LOC127257344 isoform X3 [Andrographis paniculata]|uniref:uncharacterized protein LOC127257344 isoform X3 n=1 Tax=Andrographis paniculata TaxID=175694 RepID=UPI0021E78976|nr:uncharacterized protein LOC127257344 isoform X3 [Andrographis paniculata]
MPQGSNEEQRSQNIRRLARSQILLWQAKTQEEQHEPSFSETQVGEVSGMSADATSAENTHATTSPDIVVGDDPRIEVRVESGGSIFWPRDASIKFQDVFKSKLVKEGSKWLSVLEDTRRWYTTEMKKYIRWDPAHEEKVIKKLNTRAQEAYNKWMSDI